LRRFLRLLLNFTGCEDFKFWKNKSGSPTRNGSGSWVVRGLGILVPLRMNRQLKSCALLITSLLLPLWSQNVAVSRDIRSKATVAQIKSRFEQRYRNAARLQATFLERYTENGKIIRVEAGKAYFQRPGKMRWEYESPEKNVFLVDGKMAWFYVPADHTATRVPAKKSTDWRTPLALLAGEVKLSRVCSRIGFTSQPARESSSDVVLYCKLPGASKSREEGDSGSKLPSTDSGDIAYLEIAQDSGDLVRVLVNDPGGVGIEFRFTNWQFNPQLDSSFFRFQVPPGVAIVDGELAAAKGTANP
jgi:outer membrane lipoprotein carrier protein